jgi:hypothetical protein
MDIEAGCQMILTKISQLFKVAITKLLHSPSGEAGKDYREATNE